ncbi:restriction endonuclease [Mesorhizobium sp. B2-6-3]|nr:restriction endonuclease [Mesorhizobium sp. B3-1-1]TPJ61440.1 restriction endonuclease [Mesorhizobium sp. B2-6-7]TPJ78273.1 restriction endonuclease [Mesorhizobium sp. B2-6-3]TPJ92649.1 restriction endonuclease [Mesorhizobium sp. B2-5-10]TPK04575.1 restriction endonuclease [Mesorhizobium sp. B2-5-11]TPK25115.1 restriction endonuclease [Mesorhizobium sp. B2-5-8]
MSRGLLSEHFEGVAVKRLAAVDANPESSNQHEVTGSEPLLRILGSEDRKFPKGETDDRFSATYIWLGGEQEALSEEGFLSWYDSRRNQPKRSAEWRLYYQSNAVTELMKPGDVLFLARKADGHILFIVTPDGSTIRNQLLWLFGLGEQISMTFESQEIGDGKDAELDFAARYILDEIGIELEEKEADKLDGLIEKFGQKFPTTSVLSGLARSSLPGVNAADDPDDALLLWMEREEQLFRRLERRIVAERIAQGFSLDDGADVDGFIAFSLSVQNRRKSRAGAALENHIAAVLEANKLRFAHGVETENRNRPDFLFPGQAEYREPTFPAARLTMLGSKSTVKDRWRQVLSEAVRIEQKHLLTLEPGVSENQTDEMHAKLLQLVVPRKLHQTYRPAQQAWLIDLSAFIALIRDRQS